jgi:CheY-like chemotaxis protein
VIADILVVEDDADLRELLAELLRAHGYSVEVAAHGGEALELLRTAPSRPRLILLDMMMPVMDGPAFRAAQRGDPALADIPIFVLTARADFQSLGSSMTAARVFSKPVPMPQLLTAIQKELAN